MKINTEKPILSAVLAETRKSLVDDGWIDEITALDEDGEPDDFARRVVPLESALEAIDRIEAAAREMAKGMSKKLDENCAITGNAAALREALEQCGRALEKAQCSSAFQAANTESSYIAAALSSAHAALAAPARNCDRFQTAAGAEVAWMTYPHSPRKGCRVCPNGRHLTLIEWLFAPAVQ